jgi:hypothetical protein
LTLVLALLVWVLPADSCRSIDAHFTTTPPKTDGILEEVWQTADSACAFTQLTPDFDSRTTKSTTAYVLYDRHNLYVAFNQRLDDSSGAMSATGAIAVVKLRYLFVF